MQPTGEGTKSRVNSPPSFWSGTHWNLSTQRLPGTQDPSPTSQTGLTWRVTPSLLSQRRGPGPKKQNLCSLNCCVCTKEGCPASLSPSLHTPVCQRHKGHEDTLIWSWKTRKGIFFCHRVINLIKLGFYINYLKLKRDLFLAPPLCILTYLLFSRAYIESHWFYKVIWRKNSFIQMGIGTNVIKGFFLVW